MQDRIVTRTSCRKVSAIETPQHNAQVSDASHACPRVEPPSPGFSRVLDQPHMHRDLDSPTSWFRGPIPIPIPNTLRVAVLAPKAH